MVKARELQYHLTARERRAVPNLLPFLLTDLSPSIQVETTLVRAAEADILSRIIDVSGDAATMPAAKKMLARYQPTNALEMTVLAETPQRLLAWYKYRPQDNPAGFSNSTLLFDHVGSEATITDITRNRTMVVRIVAHTAKSLNPFLQALEAASMPAFNFQLDYIGPPRLPTRGGLTPSEDRIIRWALAAGYFEVPRRTSLDSIARQMGVSASTLSATLRIASGKLARNWVKSP